jgi:hypothetical protein
MFTNEHRKPNGCWANAFLTCEIQSPFKRFWRLSQINDIVSKTFNMTGQVRTYESSVSQAIVPLNNELTNILYVRTYDR